MWNGLRSASEPQKYPLVMSAKRQCRALTVPSSGVFPLPNPSVILVAMWPGVQTDTVREGLAFAWTVCERSEREGDGERSE